LSDNSDLGGFILSGHLFAGNAFPIGILVWIGRHPFDCLHFGLCRRGWAGNWYKNYNSIWGKLIFIYYSNYFMNLNGAKFKNI
jgi:hypothetical protein